MPEVSTSSEEISLWECLHDGTLESLEHDLLARTITLVVDVGYVREFHNMPRDTRFRIVLHDVSMIEALEFQPWPGESVVPDGLSWSEQQVMRSEIYKKGCLVSSHWTTAAARVSSCKDYEFSNAFISPISPTQSMFVAEVMHPKGNDYPTLRISTGKISFFIDSNEEMALGEFLSLGAAYWNDFAIRAEKLRAVN